MSKEISASLGSAIGAGQPTWLRSAGIVIAANVLLAVCAHIALPLAFTPVPLTLQTFAVLLLGLLLSPRMAAITMAVYLAEGAAGLPVFAPTPSMPGLAHLFGPTGGYLLAYPVAAVLIAYLWRRMGKGFAGAAMSAAVGNLVILGCGALWLQVFTRAGMGSALALGVAPFLPGDALKVMGAAMAASGIARLRFRNN